MNPKDHFLFVPDAISLEQEREFSANLSAAPTSAWTQLKRRRLILAGACPNPASPSTSPCLQTKIEPWITGSLLETVNKIIQTEGSRTGFLERHSEIFKPFAEDSKSPENNKLNILINEYNSPNGILLHTDGPAYQPFVCIVSLDSTVPLIFTPNSNSTSGQISSQNGSSRVPNDKQKEPSMYDDDDDDDGSERDEEQEEMEYFQDTMAMYNWSVRAAVMKKLTSRTDLLPNAGNDSNSNNIDDFKQLQDARLYHPDSFAVVLPPRSLIVFTGDLYKNYLHGILENFVDVLPVEKILNFEQFRNSADATIKHDLKENLFLTSYSSSPSATDSYMEMSKLYLGLLSLAKVKAIDRVDALSLDYDKTLVQVLSYFHPYQSSAVSPPPTGWRNQQYFVLENNSNAKKRFGNVQQEKEEPKENEKYFVMIRDKKRTSLTYRFVN